MRAIEAACSLVQLTANRLVRESLTGLVFTLHGKNLAGSLTAEYRDSGFTKNIRQPLCDRSPKFQQRLSQICQVNPRRTPLMSRCSSSCYISHTAPGRKLQNALCSHSLSLLPPSVAADKKTCKYSFISDAFHTDLTPPSGLF